MTAPLADPAPADRPRGAVSLAPVGDDVVVVVPAFNEERTILDVISGLRGVGLRRILVVDDGSTDDTGLLARLAGVEVIRHVLNRGLGAALGTGIRAALLDGAEIIVTCDGDGQHAAADVRLALEPVLQGEADAVLGSRLLGRGHMPWQRYLANRIANLCTRALFGIWTTDSQCGLRVFSRKAAERLELECDGMEVSSEIAGEIGRHHLRCAEVPITSIYTPYSLSKGQSLRVGLRTLGKLLLRKAVGGRR